MMKQFLAIGLLIIGATAVSGQTNGSDAPGRATCNLSIEQAPGIQGLKLGLTAGQVLALFPGSNEDTEVRASLSRPASKFGVSSFHIKPEMYAPKSKFSGVSRITFTLLDGRVSTFNLGYNGPEWKNVDEFIAKFSEETNLPAADAWEAYVGMDTQLKTLRCNGFDVSIFAGGAGGNLNYVQMQDTLARQKLKERRAQARGETTSEPQP